MAFQTNVERRGDQLVVVKQARSDSDRQTLAAEAATLEAVSHPGIVAIVSFGSEGTRSELVTVHAGSMTLADFSPGSEAAAARIGASIAATVADLHSAGLCHGALAPDHIIVGSGHDMTLCSLRRSVALGNEGVGLDLASLRSIVLSLVERCPATRGRLPRRQRQALRAAIDGADAPGATAEQFAAALAAVPGARRTPGTGQRPSVASEQPVDVQESGVGPLPVTTQLPSSSGEAPAALEPEADARTWRDRVEPLPATGAGRRWRPRRSIAAAGALLAVTALAWATVVADERDGGRVPSEAREAPEVAIADRASAADAEASPPTPVPGPGVCVAAPTLIGCEDDVEVVGRFVRAGETWFELDANAGDELLIGDWDCDGVRTAAVLRPATGQVFVFSEWAARNVSLEAPVTARATPGHHGAVIERQGCAALVTVAETGHQELVVLP